MLGKNIQNLFRGMQASSFFFIFVLLANVLLVIYLGIGNYQNAAKVAASQNNAEEIIAWFETLTIKSQANEPIEPAACTPIDQDEKLINGSKPNHWKNCVEALFAPKGPFESYANLLNPTGPAYTAKCNKTDLLNSGALVFEKLTPNPAGPRGASPLEPGERIVSGLQIRLSLCDTGFYLIRIGEFKL